jgi:hypothetical protein
MVCIKKLQAGTTTRAAGPGDVSQAHVETHLDVTGCCSTPNSAIAKLGNLSGLWLRSRTYNSHQVNNHKIDLCNTELQAGTTTCVTGPGDGW